MSEKIEPLVLWVYLSCIINSITPAILLPLRPVSLMQKNPKRCKNNIQYDATN